MAGRRKKPRPLRVYRYGRKEAMDVLATFKKAVLARRVGTVMDIWDGTVRIDWYPFGLTYLWLKPCPRNPSLWGIFWQGADLPWPLRGPFPEIQNGG